MIHTNRWSPDTCDCVLEFQWDDSVAPELRVHTGTSIVSSCPAHAAITDPQAHFTAVRGENVTKNQVEGIIVENEPAVRKTETDPTTGQPILVRDPAVTYRWSYDGTRKMTARFGGVTLSAARVATLQALIDSQLGVGKAALVVSRDR